MIAEHGMSVRAACQEVRLSRTGWYRARKVRDDSAVIDALHTLLERKPRWGFWLCYKALRRAGHKWNHKRVWRVYRSLGLNVRRRAKKRVPARIKQPLTVPDRPNQCWSADFMSDTLYSGRRFRTFNLMDDFNREMLAIEVDTSLPSERVIRVLEQVVAWRGSPERLRVDNGPEFLAAVLDEWAQAHGVELIFIQPGKPSQNAYIERLNGTYRYELLDAYVFETLDEVRELTHHWLEEYNTERPHNSLGDLTPEEYLAKAKSPESSTLEWPS